MVFVEKGEMDSVPGSNPRTTNKRDDPARQTPLTSRVPSQIAPQYTYLIPRTPHTLPPCPYPF